ncbi:hypothetical protein CC86DRAFT_468106 [Ophiobolus disseminans]|uniref:Uncharacterized protein n=1 Tax=Ophiobolus disseminans TaxID=1469910 RepID=A0A6A6ZUR0_9PLEO|nr:hypothetical protein CC86DRAFT_468106 [Ophiobolus disseminans]
MAADDELPWTTSRCNRLLRPLSSKLAKLRADGERPRLAGAEVRSFSTAFATKCSPHKTTNFTRPAHKPRGFDKARDPDWRPGAKPGKKTYGGRGARRIAGIQRGGLDTGHVARPGEIAFTPLVARMGGQLQSSPQVQNSPLKKYGKNRGPLQVNIDWTQMPGELRKLVQGISEAYANVLQATADDDQKSWKGTRSLMGACLRQLPAYIELEEHFAKLDKEAEENDEERDVAVEIYEHLEAQFEQRIGQGWRPFKHIVRAHATSLLCDAMSDGVIGLDSLSMLVTHCVRVSAWDEAEKLLLSYLPLLEPLGMPINIKADLFDMQRSRYLCAVKSFVDHTGRHRLLFDLLEHMIAFELLPLEWLATEQLRPVWDRLVRSISSNDARTVAQSIRFFETITMAGMGLPDERLLADENACTRRFVPSSRGELRLALNTTYSSLLTVMCSIALVNNGREDDAGRSIAQKVTSVLDSTVIAVLNREDIQDELRLLGADQEDQHIYAQRAVCTVFASFVAHLDNCPAEKSSVSFAIPELIRGLNWVASKYSSTGSNMACVLGSLPALISSIARGTGRIWKDDGFDQLRRLVQGLMALSGCRLPHKLWTLKRLALESAMEFAQDTATAEHLSYAREIETKMRIQGQLVIVPSPLKSDSPSISGGFRWEEGIGEWVACTPFPKQGLKRIARKPIPVLELLPTPAPSEDNQDVLPGEVLDDSLCWETTAFDNDEEDTVPQSSPIKRQSRTSPLGKRQRGSSPMVIIKRTRMTPPDTPVEYYPFLPEEKAVEEGPRRSRRSKTDISVLASHLRTQRSRTSLESGLRDQRRKLYAEQIELEEETSEDTDSGSESADSSATSSDASTASSRPRRYAGHAKRQASPKIAQYDGAYEDVNERDDLCITPARPSYNRRTSNKPAVQNRRNWWKVGEGIVDDSDDDGSEDELSFH